MGWVERIRLCLLIPLHHGSCVKTSKCVYIPPSFIKAGKHDVTRRETYATVILQGHAQLDIAMMSACVMVESDLWQDGVYGRKLMAAGIAWSRHLQRALQVLLLSLGCQTCIQGMRGGSRGQGRWPVGGRMGDMG